MSKDKCAKDKSKTNFKSQSPKLVPSSGRSSTSPSFKSQTRSVKSTSPSNGKPKPRSVKSTKSSSSQTSVTSVGISPTVKRPPPVDAHLRFRLMPEGVGTNAVNIYEQRVFDCMTFVIFCAKHYTVALTNTSLNRMFSWFPFVLLSDIFKWERVCRDGLTVIIGKRDSTDDGMELTKPQLPKHSISLLNILRVQIPSTHKFYTRIIQFVKLHRSSKSDQKCCQNTSRIRWFKLNDLTKRVNADNHWGGDVVSMCRSLFKVDRIFLSEVTLDSIANYYQQNSDEARLFKHIGWPVERLMQLYEDYVHHLYPAFTMTINSFRCFLNKHDLLSQSDKRIDRLFNTFSEGGEFVSFFQLAVGLACMDSTASNDLNARIKFVFQYYDRENKGTLSTAQMKQVAIDLGCLKKDVPITKDSSEIDCVTSLSQFAEDLQDKESFPTAERLLRLDKCYTGHKETKATESTIDNAFSSCFNAQVKCQTEEGFCSEHQSKKNYDYGVHAATLDSIGRCVDPRIIAESSITQWAPSDMTRQRYSVENVFRLDSVSSMFISLVKGFMERRTNEKTQTSDSGLLTDEEDLDFLYKHLKVLCKEVMAILRHEAKLLRLTGPLFVIGDIQGSLSNLLAYENSIYPSIPVIGHKLLFLGNYSGTSCSNGIECILYLFALKIAMPNNVYLLRGCNEIRSFNKWHLKGELTNKYGQRFGEKIYYTVNRVFDYLSVGAIVEETLLCTHSGIPRMNKGLKLISAFEGVKLKVDKLSTPENLTSIGYQMIVNVPVAYTNNKDQLDKSNGNENTDGFIASSRTANMYYFDQNAFRSFLNENDFDYLIRSHNPCDYGFAARYHNRCLTVYSCHNNNLLTTDHTAVVQIDKQKIRFIRFVPDGTRINKIGNS